MDQLRRGKRFRVTGSPRPTKAGYGLAMSASRYSKVPFEWTNVAVPDDDKLENGLAWRTHGETFEPVSLVARVLETSRGPEDRRAVEVLGPDEAARRCLSLAPGFSYLPEKWHVLTMDGEPAGFVLPVIYDGCSRNGLDEATIYHMGVHPDHRGSGMGRLLLRRATRALVCHGVWRIFCDTPANNDAMIYCFEREGWTRLPAHEQPIALL